MMTDEQFEDAIDEIFFLYGNGKTEKAERRFEELVPELRRRGYIQDEQSVRNTFGLGRR